jgi:TPP-dependent pyruvate/acetoin dehydrogenase alpha subunit
MTKEELIAFEQDIAAEFNASKIRAPVHLAGGNEQQLIDIFKQINPLDWIAVTWRSHYHCLLKGVPPKSLKKDIMDGKSITLNYPDYRIISSAIVGGTLPISLGIAAGIKAAGRSEKVWVFVGDMTFRTGMYHEVRSYAYGFDLPIMFVIENNKKSVMTPTSQVWGDREWPFMKGPNEIMYTYELFPWPHAGAGERVQF